MVNVWRLMAHHLQDEEEEMRVMGCIRGYNRNAMFQWDSNNSRIAMGWGDIGPVTWYASPDAIVQAGV